MPLINHVPDDRRASLYGRPCQDKEIDPRGKITSGCHWYGANGLSPCAQAKVKHNPNTRYHKKRVINLDTGEIFEGLTEAAKHLGISQGLMSQKVSKGNGWAFADKPRNILVRNIITGEIYGDIKTASSKTRLTIDCIRRHCRDGVDKRKFEYIDAEEAKNLPPPEEAKPEINYIKKTYNPGQRVIELSTGQIYVNSLQAAEMTGVSKDTIRKHCQGKFSKQRYKYVE